MSFKALEKHSIWWSLFLEWGSAWDDYPETIGLSYIISSFNECSQKYNFRRMIWKSCYPLIMKKRWVLASVHNVCAAGGKPGAVSVSIKSFMWIFLVIITGKNNAFVPRPENDGD